MGESPVHNLKIIIYYIKKETMPQDSTSKYADIGNLIASFDANVKIGQVNMPNGVGSTQKQIQMCPSLSMSGHVEQDQACFNSYLTPEQLKEKIEKGEAINKIDIVLKEKEILGNSKTFSEAFFIDGNPDFCFRGFSTGPLALNVTKVVPWGSLNIKINEPNVLSNKTDCDIPSVCQVSTKFNFGTSNSFEIAVGEDSTTCSDILSNSWKMNAVIGNNFEIGLLFIGDDEAPGTYEKKLRLAAKSQKKSQDFKGILCYGLNDLSANKWVFYGNSDIVVREESDKYGARRLSSNVKIDNTTGTPDFESKVRLEEDMSDCITNYMELNISGDQKLSPYNPLSGTKPDPTSFDCGNFLQMGCVVRYKLSC